MSRVLAETIFFRAEALLAAGVIGLGVLGIRRPTDESRSRKVTGLEFAIRLKGLCRSLELERAACDEVAENSCFLWLLVWTGFSCRSSIAFIRSDWLEMTHIREDKV